MSPNFNFFVDCDEKRTNIQWRTGIHIGAFEMEILTNSLGYKTEIIFFDFFGTLVSYGHG